ncbi:MAG: S41 family peptidase [Flavipsychrobacter sp.]|nr:S41 family peptidase [Flavipsychrobacter sp.]
MLRGRGKKFRSFGAGVMVTAAAVLFIQATGVDSYFEVSKNLDIYATIFRELNTYYVDPIEPGKMVKTSVDGMLEELDPYTNYITESDMEDYQFQTTGKYGGIGANMRNKDGEIYIGDVYENSPAQKAGLHPGDGVISIDNQIVKGKTIDDLSLLLKGSPGSKVTIKVKDIFNGAVTDKIVTRGEIELSSVPYASLVGGGDVAFVKLTQFTPACSRLVRKALDSLKGVQPRLKGVVLDLRNNPGGLLDEAVNVCNLFLEKGELVVSTKGKVKEWDKDFKTTAAAWDAKIPVTVLINSSSASASEIVAGTLQDLDRGIVIGERSYGKGLVQTTRNLGYNAKLKLTTAKYYTPSGRCIQAIDYSNRNPDGSVGVIPDSLKQRFKTRGGREVLSGGGVEPDIAIKEEHISKLAIMLYTKNYFFDYASEYARKHQQNPKLDSFSLSSADFNDFAKWLDNKDYSYKTETEEALDSLIAIARREKYHDGAKAELTSLQQKLSHDKKQDLMKHQKEIKDLLENEIISRYYFLRGRIAQSLKDDDDLRKALEVIADNNKYQALLKTKR